MDLDNQHLDDPEARGLEPKRGQVHLLSLLKIGLSVPIPERFQVRARCQYGDRTNQTPTLVLTVLDVATALDASVTST